MVAFFIVAFFPNTSVFAEIDLQENFDKDLVAVKFCDHEVFKGLCSSHVATGFTGVWITITNKDGERKHKDLVLNECIDQSEAWISLEIIVNGKSNLVHVNLHNGRYIGIRKTAGNNITVIQSRLSFEYE